MSGKDLGSDRYQFVVDRARVLDYARRHRIEPWRAEAILAAGRDVMADIVADARRSNPVTTSPSMFPPDYSQAGKGTPTAQPGTGWRMSPPLGNPPGISLIDKMYPTDAERAKRKLEAEGQGETDGGGAEDRRAEEVKREGESRPLGNVG